MRPEELLDRGDVRARGALQLGPARLGQDRVGHARIACTRGLADEAGVLEAVEEARDTRRCQLEGLRKIRPAQPPVLRVREQEEGLVVVDRQVVLAQQPGVQLPHESGVPAQ